MKCNYCGSHNCKWMYKIKETVDSIPKKTKMYVCMECDMTNVWKSKAIPKKN